ncbi:MAG: signal peptidase II [Candidatus Woesearchaeota archaeon]
MQNKYFFFAATLLFLDQVTKFFARRAQPDNNFFFLIYNPGGALGIFPTANEALIVLSVFAILLLAVGITRSQHLEAIGFAVVLAGVAGNGIDRIFFSAVTDFIRFFDLFIFNLADVYITLGVVYLLLLELDWVKQALQKKRV